MSTDQIVPEHQVWGAPQPEPRRWGWRESAAAAAVAAVIAALGGAAIYAATQGTSHPFGASHQAPGPPGGMQAGGSGRQGGRPGQGDIAPPSLHGEFVVADGNGGYRTELTQTGAVTAISPTSITVRSQDGFSQTYVIPNTAGNAAAPFAVDDQVAIHAIRDGQTATVTNIGNPLPDLGGTGSAPIRHN
ncbi:hypothetical protein Mycsm_04771 [Mycobacterium sp. JS623]|uniref:hypothetical protein n=1 Tax=Mycobacterium sp. JS623 TaxID=212767 RepID=UPI0002A55D23|nr:hypothetical protein [Mycobacterium sp. JS623]AGB24993.1 hypothetical protein Mycsm_04771 [Mycobacterium sp. JS623]